MKGFRLRSLNLSMNKLYDQDFQSGQMSLAIKQLINEGYLRHLDLSFCNLGASECKILGELIKDNHTLWGLHFLGNEGYVDERGFIKLKGHEEYVYEYKKDKREQA